MKAKECSIDFKKTLEKMLPAKDVADILEHVQKRAKARQLKLKETPAKAYNMSVNDYIEQLEIKRKQAIKLSAVNSIIRYNAHKDIGEFKNISRGTWAYIGGIESNIKKSRLSGAANVFNRRNYFLTRLYANLLKNGVKDQFGRKEFDVDVGRELGGDDTGNKIASDIAKSIKDTEKLILKEYKRFGIEITETEDHISKLVHNKSKMISPTGSAIGDTRLRLRLKLKHGDPKIIEEEIRKTAFKRWYAAIRPLTDLDKTLENVLPEDEEKFFQSFYDATTTGIRKNPLGDKGSPFLTSSRNIARSLMQMRKWFPKDASSWIKYNEEFGAGNVHDAILNEVVQSGNLLGLMEKFGSSPADFMRRLIERARKKGRLDYKGQKHIQRCEWVAGELLGDYSRPMQGIAGKIFRSFSMLQLMRLNMLGFSSIPDINMMASALRPYGVSYTAGVAESISNLVKGVPKDELRNIALDLGVFSDGYMGSTLSKFGSFDTQYGLFSKMMHIQGKFSGIDRLDNTGKYTMGFFISTKTAQFLKYDFNNLPKGFKRIMDIYGIDENIWNVFRDNKRLLQKAGGHTFITPSMVLNLSDDDIKKAMFKSGDKINAKKIELARNDLYNRMLNFFSDQTNYGKIFPNASDIALLRHGAATDTLPGAVWSSMTQFMPFHVAAIRRTLGRFIYSNGAENLYQAIFNAETRADVGGLISYMIGSLPFGYMSYAATALAAGMTLPDLSDPKTWSQMLMRGDGLFWYGSLMSQYAGADNNSVPRELLGKPIGTMLDAVDILKKLAERKKSANEAINFFQYNAPMINFVFSKAIMDRLIFNKLHEAADPTYKYKLMRKAQQNNQHFLWSP